MDCCYIEGMYRFRVECMQVRVRSAGEGGSGHSDWSKPCVVALPESQHREGASSSRMTSSSRSASSVSVDKEASPAEKAGPSTSEADDAKRKPSKLAGRVPQTHSYASPTPFLNPISCNFG